VLIEWSRAVRELGGDQLVATVTGEDLLARYAQPHRHYHTLTHAKAVLRDSALLCTRPAELAVLAIAAAAHDVVYEGRPGQDERDSAAWAREVLRRAWVGDPAAARVEELVLTTAAHTAPPDDPTAAALLDADLAILGAGQEEYERYRVAVRAEYSAVPEDAWRGGRAAVLTGLLAHDRLYVTPTAHDRWEAKARANIARELAAL
jgi:predicted metal-dependent HD superfamily phosphohydrolase